MLDERKFSKYFKAFGDPSRLKILWLLSSGDKTVNEIVEKMDLSQPTVSRHLAILREADAVTDRREGQNVIYSLNGSSVAGCCNGFCDCLQIKVRDKKTKKNKK